MSDLVGNPKDRFSHDVAHMSLFMRGCVFRRFLQVRLKQAQQACTATKDSKSIELEIYSLSRKCANQPAYLPRLIRDMTVHKQKKSLQSTEVSYTCTDLHVIALVDRMTVTQIGKCHDLNTCTRHCQTSFTSVFAWAYLRFLERWFEILKASWK